MSRSLAVLQDPYFQASLAFAKGAAQQIGAKELSPLLLLVGFQLTQRSPEAKVPPAIADNREAITRAASRLGVDPGQEIKPVERDTFPLSRDLQKLLTSSGSGLEALVPALLKAVTDDEEAFTSKMKAIADEDAFKTIVAYASSVASQIGLSEISPEVFAAAAFVAYKDGLFRTRPSVSDHIAANTNCFEALIAEKVWTIGPIASDPTILPLGREIQAALEDADAECDLLIEAINLGMQAGAKLLSKRRIAYHEAGHAVVSSVLRPQMPITEASIIDKEDAEGYVSVNVGSFRGSREDYLEMICVALAGRAAQHVKFGLDQIDWGASSDLERATKMAWEAIAVYGLDPEFGPVDLSVFAKEDGQSSGWLFDRAQQRLQEVLKEASERAEKILRTNWAQVEAAARELIRKKKLTNDELMRSLIEKSLATLPGVRRARKLPVERDVTFAGTSGVQETLEGPVRYDAGDALVVGANEEHWPVKRETFYRFYEPVGSNKAGHDGRYRKVVRDVLALHIDEAKRVHSPDGRGLLVGKAGDWIVDYGDGDLSVVAGDVFTATYELLD